MRKRRSVKTIFLSLFAAGALHLYGQSSGRFEESKRQGLTYLKAFSFEKAAARLEEVWEQDKSDPAVAENLAIAYLNGADREQQPELEKKALELMELAFSSGGKAAFLAVHSHDKMGWIQGRKTNNFCTGRLTIEAGRIYFLTETKVKPEQHNFDLKREEISEMKAQHDGFGAFRIRAGKNTFNMFPRTWIPKDAETILQFAQKHLGLNGL